jgi:hypothetical protein
MEFAVLEKRLESAESEKPKSVADKVVKGARYEAKGFSYESATRRYQSYVAGLPDGSKRSGHSAYDSYSEPKNHAFKAKDSELISFKERKEVARVIQMNLLMGGGHNHVDPKQEELYKWWKLDKFNLLMSFLMYDRILSS